MKRIGQSPVAHLNATFPPSVRVWHRYGNDGELLQETAVLYEDDDGKRHIEYEYQPVTEHSQ